MRKLPKNLRGEIIRHLDLDILMHLGFLNIIQICQIGHIIGRTAVIDLIMNKLSISKLETTAHCFKQRGDTISVEIDLYMYLTYNCQSIPIFFRKVITGFVGNHDHDYEVTTNTVFASTQQTFIKQILCYRNCPLGQCLQAITYDTDEFMHDLIIESLLSNWNYTYHVHLDINLNDLDITKLIGSIGHIILSL